MMPHPDPRCIPAAKVHTKAMLVTNKAECGHYYVANKKKKLLVGTVIHVEITQEPPLWSDTIID